MKKLIFVLLICIILTSCAQNISENPAKNVGVTSDIASDTGSSAIADTDETDDTGDKGSVGDKEEITKPFSAEEYFGNSLFIGDSVISGLKIYTLSQRKTEPTLPGARFLETQEGVSVSDLTGSGGNGVSYTYKGVAMPFEEILIKLNEEQVINRIFIMLGTNDLALFASPSVDSIVDDYRNLLGTVGQILPDAQVIVILNTPRGESNYNPNYVRNKSFNVTLLNSYVDALRKMCERYGVKYMDAHTPFLSAKGGMTSENCSDNYIHLTPVGAKKFVSIINEFAESDG